MTALAVARFLGADAVHSQRVLVPLIAQAGLLAVLFGGDPGPPPEPWAVSAIALYPIAAWLGVVLANTEDPIQRTVTVAAAGGWARVAGGTLLVALAGDLLLVALSVLWPIVVSPYPHPWPVVLLGVGAHVACATTGTAVGLLCARPLLDRVGWSVVVAGTVVVITVAQPWLPPVGTSVRALAADGSAETVAIAVALGLGLATGAAGITAVVGRRR